MHLQGYFNQGQIQNIDGCRNIFIGTLAHGGFINSIPKAEHTRDG